MKVVNLYGPGDLRIDEVETPHAAGRDVVIKVAACGICGTDLSFTRGGSFRDGAMPLGHEASGVVVEMGPDVRGLKLGARVAINPMGEAANVIGNGGSEGAFAEYLLVRNAELGRNLLALPDGLPLSIAAVAEPLGVALHAVNRSKIQPGETAVVFGVGPIGLGAVIWLKEMGAKHIAAVDLSEERLARARHFGAETLVVGGRDDVAERLMAAFGHELLMGAPRLDVDVYIDAAGAAANVEMVVANAKRHARLVVPAVHKGPVSLQLGRMLMNEMSITTSMGYPDELGRVVERLAESPSYFEPYITARFPFADFHEAFSAASQGTSGKVMVEFE